MGMHISSRKMHKMTARGRWKARVREREEEEQCRGMKSRRWIYRGGKMCISLRHSRTCTHNNSMATCVLLSYSPRK
jgi:hypothetical protein